MPARRFPLRLLIALTGVAVVAALYGAFLYAPTERTMGTVQRIFYFHVSAGMVGLVAFLGVFVGCVAYLATRDARWDRFDLEAQVRVVIGDPVRPARAGIILTSKWREAWRGPHDTDGPARLTGVARVVHRHDRHAVPDVDRRLSRIPDEPIR